MFIFFCLAVIAAFLANLLFLFLYVWRAVSVDFRLKWPRLLISLIVLSGVFGALLAASADVPMRSGYDNDHSFDDLSFRFHSPGAWGVVGSYKKELSTLAGVSFVDILSGQRLEGILAANRILWPVCAVLTGAVLLELGAGLAGATVGAGLFGLSFLSIINAHTFSTTNWNLFYILCCLLSVCRLLRDSAGLSDWIWFFCASFLMLTSRFEFTPVIALILFIVAWRGLKAGGGGKILPVLFAIWAGVCALWAFHLRGMASENLFMPHYSEMFGNIAGQLGESNLSIVSGLSSDFWGWAGVSVMGVCAIVSMILAFRKSREWLPPAWLLLWLAYFALIFRPLEVYPLHFVRHQLYFFLPFCLFSGWAAAHIFRLLKWRWLPVAVSAVFFLVYGEAGVRAARSYNSSLRTDDIEWQFLLNARRAWPGNCSIITDSRKRELLLRKYFPYAGQESTRADDCLLFYRPVFSTIIVERDDRFYAISPGNGLVMDVNYSTPWLEQKFRHRFYTTFFGWYGQAREVREPIPLTLGLYPARLRKAEGS